ncbi:outer membrane lipoprotein-sorting protein [Alkalimarinus coralli]|uniref:outer membrane lipoprotein-sorting protein n=1 Tax=Alkalimarinus coralli TaxID=2935863 RepID=UPI00202B0914|nr:outer membrane lipoprotein-sorting protein [Alkalimarinus coralli]
MLKHAHLYCALILITLLSTCAQANDEAVKLLKKIDELYRSESSISTIKMQIVTPNWERTLEMKGWTVGMDDTFIRILSPKKDQGVSTLKKGREMWNYFPKINKVIKVPPSMMMGSWMGSDFTNDDLVREVSLVKEYHVDKEDQEDKYLLRLVPKESTVTVWARIEILVAKETLLPVEQRYFNEKGDNVRSMYFSDIKEFSGKRLPSKMSMVPHHKKNHKTVIEYVELEFDTGIDDDIFTLRNLKKRYR